MKFDFEDSVIVVFCILAIAGWVAMCAVSGRPL